MHVIKLEDDRTLIVTVDSGIIEGDVGSDNITFLVPKIYNGIDISQLSTSFIYNINGGDDVYEDLERDDSDYSESLFQFHMPITEKLSSVRGKIDIRLSFHNKDNTISFKTLPAILYVSEDRDVGGEIPEDRWEQMDRLEEKIDSLEERKADSIQYNKENKLIQLSSNGSLIGESISTEEIADDDPIIMF